MVRSVQVGPSSPRPRILEVENRVQATALVTYAMPTVIHIPFTKAYLTR